MRTPATAPSPSPWCECDGEVCDGDCFDLLSVLATDLVTHLFLIALSRLMQQIFHPKRLFDLHNLFFDTYV
jgi:hypothetical protein